MINYTIIQNADITSNISDGAFRLYILLNSYCYGEKDYCFPSQKTLAEKLHKSIRTIQRCLKELVVKKLIRIKRRGSISNLYTIVSKIISKTIDKVVEKVKKSWKNNSTSTWNNYSQRNYTSEQIARIEQLAAEKLLE